MAHIIFKSSKGQKPTAATAQAVANANAQPIIIDFSSATRPVYLGKAAWVAAGALITFLLASVIALFVLAEQMNAAMRDALSKNTTVAHINAAEPESAFPAATLTPLPSKALIIGKDFQQARTGKNNGKNNKVDLVPMLEKLPLYGADSGARSAVHRPMDDLQLEVETAENINRSGAMVEEADAAVAMGAMQKALGLYARALQLNPGDDTLRSNYVALLLADARSLDEQGDVTGAVAAYKKALSNYSGNKETAAAIRARMDFLSGKISE